MILNLKVVIAVAVLLALNQKHFKFKELDNMIEVKVFNQKSSVNLKEIHN